MKIKKYGNFKLGQYRYLYFAIMVETINGKKFITKIDRKTKTWEIEDNKMPYFFADRTVAQDLAFCLVLNGYSAYVVEDIASAPIKNYK